MPEPNQNNRSRLILEGDERDLRIILVEIRKVFDSSPELLRLASRIEAKMENTAEPDYREEPEARSMVNASSS